MDEIDELFGDSGEVRVVTLLFRGDALTPGGLAQMDALLGGIAGDTEVGSVLAPGAPLFAPSLLVKAALQADSLDGSRRSRSTRRAAFPGSAKRSRCSPAPAPTARRSRSAASACTTRATSASWTPSAGSTSWRLGVRGRCA